MGIHRGNRCTHAFCVLALAGAVTFGSTPTRAQDGDVVIEVFTSSIFPESVEVSVGSAVTFVRRLGEHQIASGENAEDPDAGAIFDFRLDASTTEFSFQVDREYPGGITFFDRLNPTIQGTITVTSGEIEHRVGVVDNVFEPENIWIFEGDTVSWQHEPLEGFHTVTSGFGRDDPLDGELFDEASSEDFPVFEFVFTEPGVCDYYCRPHEDLGMIGKVFVQKKFVRGDATNDVTVDISDPVSVLNFLFLGGQKQNCDDALDSNDDGVIDIGDPVFTLNFLFLGSDDLPPPFPQLGQDRTDDRLRCMPAES